MFRRSTTTAPSVGEASGDLASALGDLAVAAGRWVALQPTAQEVPVYAEKVRRASADTIEGAGAWAGNTASKARTRTAEVASATRTQTINLLLVAALLWWVNRLLQRDAHGS
jgi:hypothetical protein